ncbi:MAG: LysM peptidoglycan-binding domain-containing protein, partial [Acidobacteriota bacterium]
SEVRPEATAAAPPAPDAAPPAAAPAAAAPAFDTVRAEADGSVLIAGRAGPGAEVAVLADGAEVTRATADDRGQFVAFAQLVPSTSARVLTLRSGAAASEQSVILAPVEPPAQVTAAAPEAPGAPPSAPAGPEAPSPAADPAAVAPAAPEVLIADSSGVRKMAPAPAGGVVIDTISYASNGDVLLVGRAPGLVRLYLDDALVAEARPVEGTWEARLADVAPGLYRLRADEIGADGKVVSRFETPFQREAPETLAAAMAPAAPIPAGGGLPMPVLPSAPPAMTTAEATPITLPALPQGPAPVVTEATVVTVQPGFTLWRIARENYGNGLLYVKVFQANRDQIRDPDLIYPGQVFTVPDK